MPDLFGGSTDALDYLNGVRIYRGWLSCDAQKRMVSDLRAVAATAPFRRYETPGGRKMSVAMTAAGALGWMTDRGGYRYAETHQNGKAWPDIPDSILTVWRDVSGADREPDSCLVNFYGEGAKMGLHQDKDEADTRWPVVSITLGDEALFRVGGSDRKDPTLSTWLSSGDVAVLQDATRLAYHGIDRIKFRSSDLLPEGGRINVTLRIAG